jgi:hypothetical protein
MNRMARSGRSSELRRLQVDFRSIHIPTKRGLRRFSRLVDTQNSSSTVQPEMPTQVPRYTNFHTRFWTWVHGMQKSSPRLVS